MNERLRPTVDQVKEAIEMHNNTAYVGHQMGFHHFYATSFAVEGIERHLDTVAKKQGRVWVAQRVWGAPNGTSLYVLKHA
jgi:hypothetical protein